MKCPKCGYLGFETSDRCRNCGYDFSLASPAESSRELRLRDEDREPLALADLDLTSGATQVAEMRGPGLDLDQVIGAPALDRDERIRRARARAASAATASPTPPDAGLPLFPQDEELPLITTPRPPRAPLAVRRTTPEVQRGRAVAPASRRQTPTDEPSFDLRDEVSPGEREVPNPQRTPAPPGVAPAPGIARFFAAVLDAGLLLSIFAAVLYFTLALTGLTTSSINRLPLLPVAGFLTLLAFGYLLAFVAASGQTIGKMITGIRVIGDDGTRVDIGGAALRALGCAVSLLTAGLGYLPAFVGADGRALHDRLSGTRVIRDR